MSGHQSKQPLEAGWLENSVWDALDDSRIVLHGEGS